MRNSKSGVTFKAWNLVVKLLRYPPAVYIEQGSGVRSTPQVMAFQSVPFLPAEHLERCETY